MLVRLTVATWLPKLLGAKSSWNCVLPPTATVAAGWVSTWKAPAPAPLSATRGLPLRLSALKPLLLMVKVRVTVAPLLMMTPPKAVPSLLFPVAAPLAISTLFPLIVMMGPAPNFCTR